MGRYSRGSGRSIGSGGGSRRNKLGCLWLPIAIALLALVLGGGRAKADSSAGADDRGPFIQWIAVVYCDATGQTEHQGKCWEEWIPLHQNDDLSDVCWPQEPDSFACRHAAPDPGGHWEKVCDEPSDPSNCWFRWIAHTDERDTFPAACREATRPTPACPE